MAIKQRIARQFSRAAHTYDAAADIQQQISADAIAQLHPSYAALLDIGCGTGHWHTELTKHSEQLYACDLAEGMVQFASNRLANRDVTYLVADAEQLPLTSDCLDGIFSSMALQWCDNAPQLFSELFRVLKPKGHSVLAILSNGSMHELTQAWQAVDDHPHTNRFPSHQHLMEVATKAGFILGEQQKDYIAWHQDIRSVLNNLKQIGANVVTQKSSSRALTRDSLQQLEKAYREQFEKDGLLPLTYSVSFLTLAKP